MNFLQWKMFLLVRTLAIAPWQNIRAALVLRGGNWNNFMQSSTKDTDPVFPYSNSAAPRLVSFSGSPSHGKVAERRSKLCLLLSLLGENWRFSQSLSRGIFICGESILEPALWPKEFMLVWRKLSTLLCPSVDESSPDHCLLPQALP